MADYRKCLVFPFSSLTNTYATESRSPSLALACCDDHSKVKFASGCLDL